MEAWVWVGFLVFIVLLLMLDLGVFNRVAHVISAKEALAWSAFWVALALTFNGLVFVAYDRSWSMGGDAATLPADGRDAGLAWLTAYLLEKSLSLDNIFVIALIFNYFKTPPQYQHRVLFWGVFGALVLRGIMIGVGIAALSQFSWLTYVFGGLLLVTAAKMLTAGDQEIDPEKNVGVRLMRRLFPVTSVLHGQKFFVRIDGVLTATPLALALSLVETADVIFAVDSIPAVFSVTLDPFIVFSSNVFAILGLRSLYFALAALLDRFAYLKFSLVFVLAYVGVKMLLSGHFHVPAWVSLTFIAGSLLVGVLASLFRGISSGGESMHERRQREASEMNVANVRRTFVVFAGATLALMQASFFVLPKAAALTLAVGLALLLVEFAVAQRWLKRLHRA